MAGVWIADMIHAMSGKEEIRAWLEGRDAVVGMLALVAVGAAG